MPSKLVPLKRPGGRPPKHGARALARFIAENRLDRRSKIYRTLRAVEGELAEAAGGAVRLNSRELVLISRLAAKLLIAQRYEVGALRGGELSKNYIPLANSIRLDLLALGLRPDAGDKLPSLSAYIEAHSSAPEDGDSAPAHTDTPPGGEDARQGAPGREGALT